MMLYDVIIMLLHNIAETASKEVLDLENFPNIQPSISAVISKINKSPYSTVSTNVFCIHMYFF